jgi:hypothetical protein
MSVDAAGSPQRVNADVGKVDHGLTTTCSVLFRQWQPLNAAVMRFVNRSVDKWASD